jgi:hypothetical protein
MAHAILATQEAAWQKVKILPKEQTRIESMWLKW